MLDLVACKRVGECNMYRPYADWFTIVSNLYSEKKWAPLANIFPIDLLNNSAKLAWPGHLCYCVEGGGRSCTKCGQIDPVGVTLMSPATFLEQFVKPTQSQDETRTMKKTETRTMKKTETRTMKKNTKCHSFC